MKKIALAVVLLAAVSVARAQEGNNLCVWNALGNYGEGGSRDELEKAIKCSDEAIANESTMNKSKTWYYRGKLFTMIFRDSVLKKTHMDAPILAIAAFKKLSDMADPKFKDWDDAIKDNLYLLGLLTFNAGVDQYTQTKNYALAFQYFYALKDLDAVFVARKKDSNIDVFKSLRFAGLSAESAGDKPDELKAYKEWVDLSTIRAKSDTAAAIQNNNAAAFQKYAVALKSSGDTVQSVKVVEDGLSMHPNDPALLVERINFFLEKGKYTDALGFINRLLDKEPKNDGALFIKALAYDKMGNEDSVVYYYSKAIEVNPKSANSYINLAAVYVNKAKDINIAMNKLGNTTAEIKQYDDMKAQVKELYIKAKPYLEKAKDLDPDDKQVARTLYQITSFLDSNSK